MSTYHFIAASEAFLTVEEPLAEVLREVGLPAGRHARRTCCRSLYRAVLRALPATARGWHSRRQGFGLT